MRTFTVLWTGTFVSLVGSTITSFAFGVWIYQHTGSVLLLGTNYLLVFLPSILVSPFAGALVDRWDRRWPMVISAVGGIACTLTLTALYITGSLQTWDIYTVTAITSLLGAFQLPAFSATVSLLVSPSQLVRANSLVMLAQAVSQIVGPLAGGFLLGVLHLSGLLLIDCLSFVYALIVVLVTRIPRPSPTAAGRQGSGTLLGETRYSWRYVVERQGLLGLLVFYAALNFAVGFVDVLITPLVLSFTQVGALGTVIAVGGIGMVLGSVLTSAWGGPRRRIHGVLGFSVLLGLALCAGALRANVPLLAGAAFVFLFCSAVINACSRSIWQSKVEHDLQGRVMALEAMVGTSPLPIAYLVAGPVAEHVLKPVLTGGGALGHAATRVVGGGPGREMALLLFACGLAIVVIAAAGYLSPRLRRVDEELPDVAASNPVLHGTSA